MHLKIRDCLPQKKVVLGATLAQQHMASVQKELAKGGVGPGSLLVLDFEGIEGVNSSYIKGTALWLLVCGKLSANPPESPVPPRDPAEPRPYDLYVCVTRLCPDVLIEFQEFFRPRGLPMLFARRLKDNRIEEALLVGHLDPALRFTLEAMAKRCQVTAPQLHRAFPEEKVTVTAWNNRLTELHALRLVRRTRAGRAWEYEALAKDISWE